jgi:hypothetical protein
MLTCVSHAKSPGCVQQNPDRLLEEPPAGTFDQARVEANMRQHTE